jgi:hypothetical protein
MDRERERVREIGDDLSGWRRWGPYVSDRSWGTVREDHSHDGNAWGYLTYDKARAKEFAFQPMADLGRTPNREARAPKGEALGPCYEHAAQSQIRETSR